MLFFVIHAWFKNYCFWFALKRFSVLGSFLTALNKFIADRYSLNHTLSEYYVYEFFRVTFCKLMKLFNPVLGSLKLYSSLPLWLLNKFWLYNSWICELTCLILYLQIWNCSRAEGTAWSIIHCMPYQQSLYFNFLKAFSFAVAADTRVHEFFKSPYFMSGIHPIPGAQHALRRLSTFCNLSVVT